MICQALQTHYSSTALGFCLQTLLWYTGYAAAGQCDLQEMLLSVPRLKEFVGRNLLAKPNLLGEERWSQSMVILHGHIAWLYCMVMLHGIYHVCKRHIAYMIDAVFAPCLTMTISCLSKGCAVLLSQTLCCQARVRSGTCTTLDLHL